MILFLVDKLRSLRKVHSEQIRNVKAAQNKSGASGGTPKTVKWEFFSAMAFLTNEISKCGSIDSLVILEILFTYVMTLELFNLYIVQVFHLFL